MISGCPTPSPALVNINITSAPDAGVLPNNIPPICINDPGLPLNLNSLFTTALFRFQQPTGQMLLTMFWYTNKLPLYSN